ncbi:metallophosphoesterase [Streptomyces sp. CA-210063]|uniref:metallophosphoesterase n=1 Tax=Streptomyces sp. CA-210063 TaxID=2801029 RepID=UPI00214CE508|nr:metallophosphoesterase [Streptomyces sp. CA-210063]UUU31976.1 metallophosphoesterase [Streptomyces sp. CA-210063]
MDTTTLVVTTDFHSAVPGGRATLAAVRQWRARGALVVDAGDFFGGNAFHEFSAGRVEERLLAELYDALVPGNHDLTDLMRLADPGRFPPVVCANLRPPDGFAGRWASSLLLPEREPRVGIVGYLGQQAFETIPPAERAGFQFVPPTADLIATERDRLLSEGADVVIGVSHTGFAHDVTDQEHGWPLKLVVAGHCHSPSYHWASAGRHVVKAPEVGAGLLRIALDRTDGHIFRIETFTPSANVPPRPDGLEEALTEYAAWGSEQVGTLPARLDTREDVAQLLTERARTAAGADAFVLNLGSLRAGLPQTVTRQSLMDCVPFDADLVLVDSTHPVETVLAAARQLGEEPVASTQAASGTSACAIATTSYLAERLGLAARPAIPPRTLRDTLTDLIRSPHE